jgi:DNA-binding PucR family transcriptional regulator
MPAAMLLTGFFAAGPVVVGPAVDDLAAAPTSARAALAGLSVAAAWPAAPRPVPADLLLPERAIAGDEEARTALADVYSLLADTDATLVETLAAFIDSGGALESTARLLFVHPNTVRYRLRRVLDVSGFAPTNPRDRWALGIGLTLGRLRDESLRNGSL